MHLILLLYFECIIPSHVYSALYIYIFLFHIFHVFQVCDSFHMLIVFVVSYVSYVPYIKKKVLCTEVYKIFFFAVL